MEALQLSAGDHVLEIGPGKGALTALLLATGARVTAVEIDRELAQALHQKLEASDRLTIVCSDILGYDLNAIGGGSGLGSRDREIKVVGNLPYNLTSPILRKLSEWAGWSEALVMVQKEVGDRLCAKVGSGDYGALTVGMNLTCAISRVFDLSRDSFRPPPNVQSSVVRLVRRPSPLTKDMAKTQRVIQAAFQQRRKTILNSLSHGLGLKKEETAALLQRVGLPEAVRPESIDVEQFIEISDAL